MSSNGVVYEMYHEMVKQIGSEFKRKYQMVERADIEQEMWLWFSEHPNKIDEWLSLPDQKDRDKLFARSLRNSALDYCIKEKAHKAGYSAEDNFWYNKQFIKLMIPAVLSDDWTKLNNTLSNMGRGSQVLAESGNFMAFSSDIKVAFDKLNERERSLVKLFYGEQVDGAELHERIDSSKSQKAVMMEANRAVNKMVRILGGNPPVKDEDYLSNT